jgi:hypothetical protein
METVWLIISIPNDLGHAYEPVASRDRESEVRNPVWMPTELETQIALVVAMVPGIDKIDL